MLQDQKGYCDLRGCDGHLIEVLLGFKAHSVQRTMKFACSNPKLMFSLQVHVSLSRDHRQKNWVCCRKSRLEDGARTEARISGSTFETKYFACQTCK